MSDAELRALVADLVRSQKETDAQLKATGKRIDQLTGHSDTTGQRIDQLAGLWSATGKRIDQLAGLWGNQLGRLTEAMVAPACLKLFQARGLAVRQSMRRAKVVADGESLELDVLLLNGDAIVAVEVKTACRVQDVDEVLADMVLFRRLFPQYAQHRAYGAIAALEYLEQADRYAERQGLFVLRPCGDVVEIANPLNFQAKVF